MALVFAEQSGGALVFVQQPYAEDDGRHEVVFTDTAPRLWWQRKPKKLDDAEAEQKIVKVAQVIERIAKKQTETKPDVASESKALKAEVRQAVKPLVAEMPGFDWTGLYSFILAKLLEQEKQHSEQERIAMLMAQHAIAKARDEDDLLVLLMGI